MSQSINRLYHLAAPPASLFFGQLSSRRRPYVSCKARAALSKIRPAARPRMRYPAVAMQTGFLRTATVFSALLASCLSATAATGETGWRVRAEAAAKVRYDSNVFLQDGGPAASAGLPASAAARAEARVGTLGAGLGATSPATPAGTLALDYHVDLVRFRDFAAEDHADHRLRAGWEGQADAWTWDVAGSFLLTDGSDLGPVYCRVGGGPAIGGEPVRARRDQTLTKASARLTRRLDDGWLRALAAYSYQDFDTRFVPGFASYVDRGETLAGLEAARDLRAGFAIVAGARAGAQTQGDRPPLKNLNSSNTLVRALAGLEVGRGRYLKIDLRAGPDFRHYPHQPASLAGDRASPYAELAATWTPAAADTVMLGGKHWMWVGGSGRSAYEESTWDLAWKHRISRRLHTRLALRLATADSQDLIYPCAKPFRDFITTVTVGAVYRLAAGTVLEASLSRDEGDSRLPDRPGHEYTRVVAGVGVSRAW
jgi:hypothetical protein